MFQFREHQLIGAELGVSAPGHRFIFAHEPGCGKTATAIETLRRLGVVRPLVVCPAVMRGFWEAEFKKVWPDAPQFGQILAKLSTKATKKKKAFNEEAYARPGKIVSYNLVREVLKQSKDFDALIIDELHLLKNPKAEWSKGLAPLAGLTPLLPTYGLTGTLLPNQVIDLHNQLDIIYPKRFGNYYKFGFAYTNATHNGYGWSFKGRNSLREDELRMRLAKISHQVTKAEIAHTLPDYQVRLLPVMPARDISDGSFAELFELKKPHIVDWYNDAAQQATHVCIMTHLRKNAEKAAELLTSPDVKTYVLHGALPASERYRLLQEAKAQPRALICATMHAMGTGIDMTFCARALLAELYYRPATVVQALGRFSRLSSIHASSVDLMVLQGTPDERLGMILEEKLSSVENLLKLGTNETMFLQELRTDDTDWAALCGQLVGSTEEE